MMLQSYIRSCGSNSSMRKQYICTNSSWTRSLWTTTGGSYVRMPLSAQPFQPVPPATRLLLGYQQSIYKTTSDNNSSNSSRGKYNSSRKFSSFSLTTPCKFRHPSNVCVPSCDAARRMDDNIFNTHYWLSKHSTTGISKRYIQSEREYLIIVTDTLQTIHDAIDNVLDQQTFITDYEISFSQGVLTLKFPPYGTWVINQQTPNLQIWVNIYLYKCIVFSLEAFCNDIGNASHRFSALTASSSSCMCSGPVHCPDRNDSNMMITISYGSPRRMD